MSQRLIEGDGRTPYRQPDGTMRTPMPGVFAEVPALRLNFACGGTRWDGFDNSDNNREPGTTFVDLKQIPYPYEDESAELILISHALFMGNYGVPLHPDLAPMMAEFYRILEPGGWLRIDDNPLRCPDPTEEHEEGLVKAESERGYNEEWKLPRQDLLNILIDVGFSKVTNNFGPSLVADAFPDDAAAIVGNQNGHYSFRVEAQK